VLNIPVYPIIKALRPDAWIREPDDRWAATKCPFHEDSQASASICLSGFNCHACGIRGDAIALLKEVEGLDYPSALARAAEILGRSEEDLSGKPDAGKRRRKVLDDDEGPTVGQRKLFSSRRRKRPATGP
jgi:DNA primase